MATFCFLVTGDLIKEAVWRTWFEALDAVRFPYKIATHCSNPSHIKSAWLRATLIPTSVPTSWQFHTRATLALYEYAFHETESEWITLHSESCVPIVEPARFVTLFNDYKGRTVLSHRPIWWDPAKIARANLIRIPAKFHVQHSEWCILSREDLVIVLMVALKSTAMANIVLAGPAADESFVGVALAFHDRLKDALNTRTTLVDWKRSPNGNNPYTFTEWTSDDEALLKKKRSENPLLMFMRKVGPTLPDEVITSMWLNKCD